MPGTLRWIMNGMTLMPAPTIEQTPVAVKPARPISRASCGLASGRSLTMCAIGGFYRKLDASPAAGTWPPDAARSPALKSDTAA